MDTAANAEALAEAALRAQADAAIAGSEPLAADPTKDVAISAASLAQWTGEVEAEFGRVNARVDLRLAEMTESSDSTRAVVNDCTAKLSNLETVLTQFIANHVGRSEASRSDGDGQDCHLRKAQLSEDLATWKKVATARKLWILRGSIPPNLGDSPADLQSFVGEAVYVSEKVSSQLRTFGGFDVSLYRPRVEGVIGHHQLMVADHLDLLRAAVVAVLSVGLSSEVAEDLPCLARVAALGEAFTGAGATLRTHYYRHFSLMSDEKAQRVMCDMVNDDLRAWVNELMCASLNTAPSVIPPPASTAFDMPPLPKFTRTAEFCQSGGEVLKLVLSHVPVGGGGGETSFKRKAAAPPAGSLGGKSKPKAAGTQICRMFAGTGKCAWKNCKFLHPSPPSDSTAPTAFRDGGGGSATSGGGSRAMTLHASGAGRGDSRGGAGGGGGGSG